MPIITKQNTNSAKKNIAWPVKYFKIFIILIPALVLISGYFLLIKSVMRDYGQQKDEVESIQSQLDAKLARLVQLRGIIADYENFSLKDKEKIDKILPDDLDESDLYVNLESLTLHPDINVVLNDISITPDNSDSKAKTSQEIIGAISSQSQNQIARAGVEMSLSEVNYINLKSLFRLLEKNMRLLDVRSFDFDSGAQSLGLSFVTYYLK